MAPRPVEPAVLVSYPYVREFLKVKHLLRVRSWALDSGAVTAKTSGIPIDVESYTTFALGLVAADPTLAEVFALDVIGDWRASLRNAEYSWKRGLKAIPCWHGNEPEHALVSMARDYPKVAIGGIKGMRGPQRVRIYEQVFARIWPKQVHGFGLSQESLVMHLPFHSVDASSWELGPMKFRQFKSHGNARLKVPCAALDLAGEVDHFIRMEARARARWGATFAAQGWLT